jgi:hypothetical protein
MIAIYAILGGIAFFLMQTSRLISPQSTNDEMQKAPLGRYEWGYLWSDTLVAGPALFIGGIALLFPNRKAYRMGQLLSFSGFAINLYAMIGIWIGFWAIGHPMRGALLWGNIGLTILGVLCMIYLGVNIAETEKNVQSGPRD